MIDSSTAEPSSAATGSSWARVLALALVVLAIGLPVDHLSGYALLLIAAVLIFSGRLTLAARNWLIVAAAVAAAALLPLVIAPAPIAQGENVFLPGKPGNVLERGLPGDVYKFMRAEFDAQYPPAERCKGETSGCWVDQGFPARLYAFSADGAFGNPRYSRNVAGLDFSDPVWLRLGFVNDKRYNWASHRGERDRRVWAGLHRWTVTMPWFVMVQFPADYAGSRLCWRGTLLWPNANGHYAPLRHAAMSCRTVAPADIGAQIFGAAIAPGSLAMTLHAPAGVQARLIAISIATLLAVLALLVLLVRVNPCALAAAVRLARAVADRDRRHRRKLHRRLAPDGRRRRRALLHRHRPRDPAASPRRRRHGRAARQ